MAGAASRAGVERSGRSETCGPPGTGARTRPGPARTVNAPPRGFPLGLVVNPAARAVQRRHLGREPFWRGLVPDELVRLTGNLEELDGAIAAFRDAGVRAVAGLGGDGSTHHLVDAILRRYEEVDAPMVLALAGGTMNGLPRALGTGGAPEGVLRAAVAALAGSMPQVRMLHMLRVTDVRDGRTHYGFSFATGLVYRVYQQYYRNPEPGMVDAVAASLLPLKAALFGGSFYDGVRLDVRAEGAPWLPEPPHTLVASVVDQPLLWFRPFGSSLGNAAGFHLGATAMRPSEIAPRLWSIFRGRCRHPRLRIGNTRDVTVRGNVGYLIDGDLYPGDAAVDVRLTVGPRLRFLVPAANRPR